MTQLWSKSLRALCLNSNTAEFISIEKRSKICKNTFPGVSRVEVITVQLKHFCEWNVFLSPIEAKQSKELAFRVFPDHGAQAVNGLH